MSRSSYSFSLKVGSSHREQWRSPTGNGQQLVETAHPGTTNADPGEGTESAFDGRCGVQFRSTGPWYSLVPEWTSLSDGWPHDSWHHADAEQLHQSWSVHSNRWCSPRS